MNIHIKTPEEIEKMRIAGQLAADVLHMIREHVQPGITTDELDQLCHRYIVDEQQAIPAPLHYKPPGHKTGFPKSICTSVNHQICHGIPGKKKLKNGDIINIDITVIKNGFHGDTSKMFAAGAPNIKAKRIMQVSYDCMCAGIEVVKPGAQLNEIGYAIQQHAHKNKCSIVREFCGHGIGKGFHEDPQVLHYGDPSVNLELKPGMTFTIEPMINLGKRHMKMLPDHWTAVTKDKSLSAQWEHTILVTETGYEILTQRPGDSV